MWAVAIGLAVRGLGFRVRGLGFRVSSCAVAGNPC